MRGSTWKGRQSTYAVVFVGTWWTTILKPARQASGTIIYKTRRNEQASVQIARGVTRSRHFGYHFLRILGSGRFIIHHACQCIFISSLQLHTNFNHCSSRPISAIVVGAANTLGLSPNSLTATIDEASTTLGLSSRSTTATGRHARSSPS